MMKMSSGSEFQKQQKIFGRARGKKLDVCQVFFLSHQTILLFISEDFLTNLVLPYFVFLDSMTSVIFRPLTPS